MKFAFFLALADVFQIPSGEDARRGQKASVVFFCLSLFAFSLFAAPFSAAAQRAESGAGGARKLMKDGKKFVRRGEFLEAEKAFRRALEINPNDTTARLNLAYVLVKQRQTLEAYKLSYEAARSEPKNAFAFAVLGSVLLSAGNFRDARLAFVNALELDRETPLAWAGLGTLNFYENRISVGLDQLQAAVFLEPLEPDYLFMLAQIAARAEDYNQSAEAYEKFLVISPQTDADRRERIKGLINFLKFLGGRRSLYSLDGADEASVPFRLVNDRPVVQMKINRRGEPLNFVLDTGSGISVISNETAKLLKIKPVTRGGKARGVGGDGTFEIVYGFLRSAEIGGVRVGNVPVYIREFHGGGERIDGYIGLSLISKFLTTIDYGSQTLLLKKKTSIETAASEALSLPLRLTSSGFLSGEVELSGIKTPLNFIVDTGASISVVSRELAASDELTGFVKGEKMRVVGAAGITEEMPALMLPKISFGANSRESVKAVALDLNIINETSGFEQAGILGGNFL
jgi:Tfp pilus assembly protein PilF/predicted aspartyl protease